MTLYELLEITEARRLENIFEKNLKKTKIFLIAKCNWRKKTFKLTLYSAMSQNGQTHFKDFAANAARFLKCV